MDLKYQQQINFFFVTSTTITITITINITITISIFISTSVGSRLVAQAQKSWDMSPMSLIQ